MRFSSTVILIAFSLIRLLAISQNVEINSGVTTSGVSSLICGNSLIDSRDAETYLTVQIGTQCWMAENLNYNPGKSSWCYDNNPNNCTTYGRLYDWSTASGKGVCPGGWHLPSNTEWSILENQLNPNSGYKMKVKTENTPFWGESNSSGFSALSAGNYNVGSFGNMGWYSYFWSATERSSLDAWSWYLGYIDNQLNHVIHNKTFGYSVRCVKD